VCACKCVRVRVSVCVCVRGVWRRGWGVCMYCGMCAVYVYGGVFVVCVYARLFMCTCVFLYADLSVYMFVVCAESVTLICVWCLLGMWLS